jgi:hypothetical protein
MKSLQRFHGKMKDLDMNRIYQTWTHIMTIMRPELVYAKSKTQLLILPGHESLRH